MKITHENDTPDTQMRIPRFLLMPEDAIQANIQLLEEKLAVQNYIRAEQETEIQKFPGSRAAEVARHRLGTANYEIRHLSALLLCLLDRIEQLESRPDNGNDDPSPAA